MAPSEDLVSATTTLKNLDNHATLHRGLIAVASFGLFSFLCTVALFLRLAWRLIYWTPKPDQGEASTRSKQLIILLINLVFADIQQSIAFLLNIQWVIENSVVVGTPTCWAQGKETPR